jgi:flagellar protein FliS
MMHNPDAYRAMQAYRSAATTVPPLTAVVMLLDAAIVALHRTIEARESRRFEDGHQQMMRAVAILRGLDNHLNLEKGGPLAERLSKTYNSLIVATLRAFGRADATPRYRRLIASLTELRDAWKTVAMPVAKPMPLARVMGG